MPEYPSYRYHPTKPPVIVASEEEDAVLEKGYRPQPYAPGEALPLVPPLVDAPESPKTPRR
jgi:hypothetical protein